MNNAIHVLVEIVLTIILMIAIHKRARKIGFAEGKKVGYHLRKGLEFGRMYGMPNPTPCTREPNRFHEGPCNGFSCRLPSWQQVRDRARQIASDHNIGTFKESYE